MVVPGECPMDTLLEHIFKLHTGHLKRHGEDHSYLMPFLHTFRDDLSGTLIEFRNGFATGLGIPSR